MPIKALKTPKKGHFWPISQHGQTKSRPRKNFQGLPVYNIGSKHVQTDQGYQSHRLPSDLDTYMWRYWQFFKTAPNPPPPKKKSPFADFMHPILTIFWLVLLLSAYISVFSIVLFLEKSKKKYFLSKCDFLKFCNFSYM